MMSKRKKRRQHRAPSRHTPARNTGPSFEDILDRAERLSLRGQYDQALMVLEEVEERYQRHPDFLLLRGQAFLSLGLPYQAIQDLEAYLKRRSKDTRMYFPLALAYTHLEWRAHIVQALRRYLGGRREDTPDEDAARELLAMVEPEVLGLHEEYNVPEKNCVKSSYYNEEAMRALSEGQFHQALRATRRAMQLAPEWPSPYNNRASALALSGRLDEAITQTHEVLDDIAPGNVYALANLLTFYALQDDREAAQPYLEKIRALDKETWAQSDLEKIIEGLAYWEDGASLWEIAQWVLDVDEIDLLSPQSAYMLAVAAVETQHNAAAQIYFQYAWDMGLQVPIIDEILDMVEYADDGEAITIPTVSGRLSYVPGAYLIQAAPMEELFALLQERDEQEGWNEPLLNKRDELLARHPQMKMGLINLLRDTDPYLEDFDMQVDLATKLNTDQAYEILNDFALSQRGPQQARLHALMMLSEAGRYQRGEQVRIWNEDEDAWRDVKLAAFQIREPETSQYAPEVVDLLNQAIEAGHHEDYETSITLLQKALELDPHCGQAAHNLGVMLIQQGDDEEGKTWIKRAIEIEPDYLFPRATLAKLLILEDRIDEALTYLDDFVEQPEMPPMAYIVYQEALFELALAQDEPEHAEQILKALEELYSEDPIVQRLQERLESYRYMNSAFAGLHNRWLESVHRRHDRMLNRKLGAQDKVKTCLDRLTKEDALTVTAKRLGLRAYGRKAELIENIAAQLKTVDILRDIVDNLGEPEREALQTLLNHDGIMPWQAFTAEFGDDYDESPYWKYHEPATVPGILKLYGLLTAGTYQEQEVAFIPKDLRPLLNQVLD